MELLLSAGVGFSRRAGSSSKRPEGRHAGAVVGAGPAGVAGRAMEAATRADRTRQI